VRATGVFWNLLKGFHEHLSYYIFMKFPPSLLQYVPIYCSIYQHGIHHHLKLNGDTPRTGRPLFWVITPARHTIICVQREVSGIFYTISRMCNGHPKPQWNHVRKTQWPAKSSFSYYSVSKPGSRRWMKNMMLGLLLRFPRSGFQTRPLKFPDRSCRSQVTFSLHK